MYHLNQSGVRQLLKSRRITQEEAASMAKVGLSTFKSYLKNQRTVPMQVVIDLAVGLGEAPSKLLGPSDPVASTMDLAKALGISVEDYGRHLASAA